MESTEIHSLTEILQNTLEEINILFSILQKESQSLSYGHSDEIESVAKQKHASVKRIDQLTELQNSFFESIQLPIGETGFNRFLERFSHDKPGLAEIQKTHNKIKQSLEICRSLNNKNGASIELLNRHTQRAIDILRNQTQQPSTYGPDGSRQQSTVSRAGISV